MPSLTDWPFGAERFRMTLADPSGFSLTMIPFTLASGGTNSLGTGPSANPLVTQPAIASVTSGPWL